MSSSRCKGYGEAVALPTYRCSKGNDAALEVPEGSRDGIALVCGADHDQTPCASAEFDAESESDHPAIRSADHCMQRPNARLVEGSRKSFSLVSCRDCVLLLSS